MTNMIPLSQASLPPKLLRITKSVALNGEGTGSSNNYRLAACLFDRKGRILEVRANTYKTHPLVASLGRYPYLHAEMYACISLGLDQCDGLDMLVLRVLRSNELSMAKPCEKCSHLLKLYGVRNAYYSEWKN